MPKPKKEKAPKGKKEEKVPVALVITPASATVMIGETYKFTAETNSKEGVQWSVTSHVGTISDEGLFSATALGKGQVMAMSLENISKTATAEVTVVEPQNTEQAPAETPAEAPAEAPVVEPPKGDDAKT